MKLHRLNIHDFRSHEASTLDFSDFTVLAGAQGAGKTSVLDSICAALTGRTRLTDRRGSGLKDNIRRGRLRAEIELECFFDEKHSVASTVKRIIAESGNQLEVPFGGKNLSSRQALLTDRLGGVDEIPDVLLDPRLFADRPPEEQKQTLLKLLRPPTIEVPKAAQAAGIQSLASVQQVDDHIKNLKDSSVRSLNAVIKNLEETMPEDPTAEQLEEAQKAYAAVDDASRTLSAAQQSVWSAERLLDDARKLEQEYATATDTAKNLPSLRESLTKAADQLKAAIEAYQATAPQVEAKSQEFGRLSGILDAAVKQLSVLDKIGDKCPTCSRKMTEKARTEISEETITLKSDTQYSMDVLKIELTSLRQTLSTQAEEGKKVKDEVARLKSEISDAERAEKLLAQERTDIANLEASLAGAHSTLESSSQAVARADDAKEAARVVLQAADTYKRVSGELSGHRTKREAYLSAVESLIALKDSILGGDSAKRLQLDCTDIFQAFFPDTRVILDPSGASVSPVGEQEGTPASHLSSGQKVILDMGLRIAAARATGFNVLAIDDANKLAPAGREEMLRCLKASGCQVIMCTTADKIGPIPGVTVYSLSNPGVWGPTKVQKVG